VSSSKEEFDDDLSGERAEQYTADEKAELSPFATFGRNVLGGAWKGAAFAGVLLVVAALRFAFAAFRGIPIKGPMSADLPMIELFFVSFIVAGGVLGALKPFIRDRQGLYVSYGLIGAGLGTVIGAGVLGGARMTISAETTFMCYGALIGVCFAIGIMRSRAEDGE
jgi:hypothetical protein